MQLRGLLKLTIPFALTLLSCTDAPSVETLIAQAESQSATGDLESAVYTLRRAEAQRPEDPEIRLLMADAYLDLNRGDLASVTLDQAVDLGADPSRVLLLRADALFLQGEYFELLALTPPKDHSPIVRINLLLRQAEARLALRERNPGGEEAVTHAYLEIFDLVGELGESPQAESIITSLDESRMTDDDIERAWQHFICRQHERETTYWRPNERPDGAVVRVGAGRAIKTPADAARVAKDGAVVEIDAGTYAGGIARWPQHRLTVRGVGGRPLITANGRGIEDRDVWLFEGDRTLVENVEISGAQSPYENGAAIRHIGNGLTLRHVYFHDNENGVLISNRHSDNEILIEYSEFSNNGDGKGHAHNMYIGRSARFEIRFSYSHESRGGHLVKSRARQNVIAYNRISDNEDGTSSYLIDIPEGGIAQIIGNVLQQGYLTSNHAMISFGGEQVLHEENRLVIANNTLYNRDLDGIGVRNPKNLDVVLINNLFAGAPVAMVDGAAERTGNQTFVRHGLVDPRAYDFRLGPDAPAIDMGSDTGPLPTAEYVHPLGWRPRNRVWKVDVGAFERCGL